MGKEVGQNADNLQTSFMEGPWSTGYSYDSRIFCRIYGLSGRLLAALVLPVALACKGVRTAH